MKWLGRLLCLLIALIVGASPLIITSSIIKGWAGLDYLVYFGLALVGGAVGILVVAIPGLRYLDETPIDGWWPGLALGAGVGIVAAVVGSLLMSSGQPGNFAYGVSRTLLPAIGLGLVGAGAYAASSYLWNKLGVRGAGDSSTGPDEHGNRGW